MTQTEEMKALSRLVQLGDPVLQRMELGAPWCTRIDGCRHPGMYVVHRGASNITVFGRTVRLEQGDVMLLPSGGGQHVVSDVHGTKALSPDEFSARVEQTGGSSDLIRLRGSGAQTLMSGIPFQSSPLVWLPRVLVVRSRDRDPVARSLFSSYEQALDHGEASIVERVAEAFWLRSIAALLPKVGRLDLDVLRAATMVLESPAVPHTLESLARAAALSRSRFSLRFTSAFQEAPMRWVQRIRMDYAERLLREGDLSVAAIAAELGFNDESAFRKAYRRIQGKPARRFPIS